MTHAIHPCALTVAGTLALLMLLPTTVRAQPRTLGYLEAGAGVDFTD